MVSFEIFVKSMPPSLSELKVLPSFCFAFKIPEDVAVSTKYLTFKGQELPGNDYWTRFVKKEDTSKKDKKYLASVMRSIPLEMFGPAE